MWMKQKTGDTTARRSIFITAGILLLLCVVSLTLFGFVFTKEITLIDDENKMQVTTSRIYLEELLTEQDITLRAGDRISAPLDSILRNHDTISIERGKKIVVSVDGTVRDIYSCAPILSEALAEWDITLDTYDEIDPYLETPVTEGMCVQINRVRVFEETRTEVIPYAEIVRPNYAQSATYSAIIQEGSDGSETVTYKVITRDGVEISRDVLSTVIHQAAVDKVVEKGVQGNKIVAASASELKVKQVIDCSATAYSFNVGSITASGRPAAYGVIAVDPRVIPLGSKLYIESVDGSWVYGYAIAGDTGGAIKGNRIDLFYNTTSECYRFGRRMARVYVLE
ncbi:MAG: hypothetical protein E7393_04025 [Ruminococcaceae bacterium]|nr:hypothetical protein [Oscillospiraceae bacterium]